MLKSLMSNRASFAAWTVKDLPAMQETQVHSLGWEDPLEKGMAKHSRYACLEKPMDRGAWQATWGHKESDTTEQLKFIYNDVV